MLIRTAVTGLLIAALLPVTGCRRDLLGLADGGDVTAGAAFSSSAPFTAALIQGRTFINGGSVVTTTYLTGDGKRTPYLIDFNGDGRVDPVVGYGTGSGEVQGVLQILLSDGAPGTVDFISLTLDSKREWAPLADVAVGDIDGDGRLDIVGAAEFGVVYMHHPADGDPKNLRAWGAGTSELEFLEGSTDVINNTELEAILAQALGPGVNLDNYDITVEQGYANVAIGDFDGDGDNDIAASRRLKVTLSPKPGLAVPPLQIIDGSVQIFVNPGGAVDGAGWTLVPIGQHERHQRLDRDGAADLLPYDLDGDGDLDVVSSARDDSNVQVAWFENPGVLDLVTPWTQWRIGSIRDAASVVLADVTGDDLVDVLAVGPEQKQLILFEQPPESPKRTYDWDTHPIVTFTSFEPRSVLAIDIDNDGALELVVGGTVGAVRYFERPLDPRTTWTAAKVADLTPEGDVGKMGYGDLDSDGDLDLIAVVDTSSENETDDRIDWIRND